MKTLKQTLGWILFFGFLLGVGALKEALSSNVSGVPTALTANSVTTTGANTCLTLTSGTVVGKFGCGSTGTSNPIFYGVTGSTVTSGKVYAFYVSIDAAAGQECVLLAGSPALPTGWSMASPGVGLCTITMPAVTTANKVIPIITAQGLQHDCVNSNTSTTTTIIVKCEVPATGAAANTPFAIVIYDWN